MKQAKYSGLFTIEQPVDVLFPLFSAEGEKHWVPGWDYINLMGYTDLHEDYVFLTSSHTHASGGAIWLVKRHEPDRHFVQFYKVEPEVKIGIISVQCEAVQSVASKVTVTYHYIALSETGERFISDYTQKDYDDMMTEWQRLLLAYFDQREN